MSSNTKTTATKQEPTPALVPKLRFPEFRSAEGWARRTLGKFLIERSEYPKGPVPLFSLTIEDGVTPKTERYERAFLVKDAKDAYKLMLPDDFAFNPMNLRFGAIGRHSGKEAVAVSKYYNIFFCDPSANAKFCELYFRSDGMIAFYDNMAIGSLIEKRRVHFSDFLKFDIPFPPLPEQQKIAECLSSVDELMAAQARKLDALKTHKKGLMQQLFPRERETQPRLRFPEFQHEGEWGAAPMGTLLMSSPDYGVNAAAVPFSDQLPKYLRITDISEDGRYLPEKQVSVDLEATDGNYLDEGDIVLARTGASVGKSYQYRTEDGRLVFAGFLIRVKPHPKKLVSTYLANFLTTGQFWAWVAVTSARSGQPGINSTEYSSLTVPLPPTLPEQQRIALCLSSLDELINAETQKLEALKTHKKGLMQHLFPSSEGSL